MRLPFFLTPRPIRRWALVLAWLAGAAVGGSPARAAPSPLRRQFFALLHAGDSVYAQRQSYASIRGALAFFNRAAALAERSRDTLLLAEAAFATGRVYDAWNKEPQRTIAHFRRAIDLFGRVPGARRRYYYARYLLVHAHDKVPDTVGAVRAARVLYRELRAQPDSVRQQVPTTVELAWSCTEVGAYALADSVLRHLTRRAWIRNDPNTYDHLTHYYLVRARLDLLYHRRGASAYLDSLDAAYQQVANRFDRQYYSQGLSELFATAHRYGPAYRRLAEHQQLTAALDGRAESLHLRRALLRAEQRAEAERVDREAARRRTQRGIVGGLVLGLGLLGLLSAYLFRQRQAVREQARALARVNQQLDDKVSQVELLNKEIQHRVKNNLHMIFSLLQMQERRSSNDEVIESLQAARLRVESIAALHNQLLRDPDHPDLSGFLRELIAAVIKCLANDRQVITHLHTGELHLPANAYFALSLILNEWVTNSIKYAAPVADVLEINVAAHATPHEVRIAYADNGPATPAPATPPASGLGTQIIQLLCRQLGARLRTVGDHPYHYELAIPRAAPAA